LAVAFAVLVVTLIGVAVGELGFAEAMSLVLLVSLALIFLIEFKLLFFLHLRNYLSEKKEVFTPRLVPDSSSISSSSS
jgi:hypothetical protein